MLDGGQSIEDALLSAPSDFDKVVYHVASVFGPTDDHRQTALDNVKGTEDLVKTLSKFPKALLVLTSSMAAVRGTGQVPLNGKYYTCEDFNTLSELGKNWGSSYQWSKAESERRAWELSKSLKVPMVSLCPAFIFGPTSDGSFANTKSYSITLVEQWLRGESQVQSRLCVDVRDVAKAHVAAGTLPNAVGKRFVVSTERRIPSKTTAETLREISPTPEKITFDASFDGGAIKIGEQEVLSEERLQRELGVLLTSPQTTFREMGRIIMSKGGSSSSG
jgi:nucleoside-diphosphate-sugar epimerase